MESSLANFGKVVNPEGIWTEHVTQSYCCLMAYLVPWFAMQSKQEEFLENLTEEKRAERQERMDQASKSDDFLVHVLTKKVRFEGILNLISLFSAMLICFFLFAKLYYLLTVWF